MSESQWQLRDRAREEVARLLEEQGVYGATTQYVEHEVDELLAQWNSAPADGDVDGRARS
jgi:hypothetical protein